MTEKPFEVGEIVYLKSGSPTLTVALLLPGEFVRLTWMAGREARSSRFPSLTLTRENPGFDYGADDALPNESLAGTTEETVYQTSFPQEAMREALASANKTEPGRAKGGFAAAAKMTPDQRSERGRKGAEARWRKK